MNKTKVSMKYLEDAKDKVMMGVERKSMVLTDEDKKITAYHEAGHALVAYFTKFADPVHKITIVPRGRAMGLTAQIPEVERYNYSNKYLLGKLDILMGGRCAEKIIFNNFTTGAGNDISVATNIAKKMVSEWGMSEAVGPMALGKKDEEVFLGKEISKSNDFSEEKSRLVDNEITTLIKNAEKNATNILKKYLKQLHDVSKVLIERETLDRTQFEDIVKNGVADKEESKPLKKRVRRKTTKKINCHMLNNSCEIMGVLNITPDSFYDGKYLSKSSLQKKFQNLETSDIIDIGAESTRPGAKPLPEKKSFEELKSLLA